MINWQFSSFASRYSVYLFDYLQKKKNVSVKMWKNKKKLITSGAISRTTDRIKVFKTMMKSTMNIIFP